eukprot:CAMPEP_0118897360 /NCGR_PEP_ID=MMETSP1166-20130328/4791_1 /TAXON_ID=1104430 /ORGANISM="Chrysoreinhardia sp, Strain CCMP3193" /LENGTH=113 /DNA_ID=CAMNT_0006836429 /DNA_START=449 /DNA_END=791 /DNA_ORIENTATION=+
MEAAFTPTFSLGRAGLSPTSAGETAAFADLPARPDFEFDMLPAEKAPYDVWTSVAAGTDNAQTRRRLVHRRVAALDAPEASRANSTDMNRQAAWLGIARTTQVSRRAQSLLAS